MKVLPFQIPKPEYDALIFQEDHDVVFYDKFHQHNEIQVSLIEEGEGTLIVGDTINDYKKNDVLVIGSNVPHVFKSEKTEGSNAKMVSLFFTKDAFGDQFFGLEEMRELKTFFKKVDNGFKVSPASDVLKSSFISLKNGTKFERFITLLSILKTLSKSRTKPLSSFIYEKKLNDVEGKRMRDVMAFTMDNYSKSITLEDISHVAAMTKNAFCKYFKKRTHKTYFKFLNEIRVEYACKLLVSNEDYSIAEIADKSGFNNISNFNRQFKNVKQIVPTDYKRMN